MPPVANTRRMAAPAAPAPAPAPEPEQEAAATWYDYIVQAVRAEIDFPDWNEGESEQDYLYRLMVAMSEIPEPAYDMLAQEARDWYVTSTAAINAREEIVGPDGFYEDPSEEGQQAAPEPEPAPEPAPAPGAKKGIPPALAAYQQRKREEKAAAAGTTVPAPAGRSAPTAQNGAAGQPVTRGPVAAAPGRRTAPTPAAPAPAPAAPARRTAPAPAAAPQAPAPAGRRPAPAAPSAPQAPAGRRPVPAGAVQPPAQSGRGGAMAASDPVRNRDIRRFLIEHPEAKLADVKAYCGTKGPSYTALNDGTLGQLISTTRSTIETLYEMKILQ